MKFMYPYFLYALFGLAIPIIIHLFNFRRFKKVLFSSVRFLKEIKQETQSKSKLKHLLILCARMLAVLFLVFAFAQPYIPVEKNNAESISNLISIYVDNSFSMDAVGNNNRLLAQGKELARNIADNYRSTDGFQLLTNDFEGKHQRMVNKEEFMEWLEEVEISPSVKSISDVITRQLRLLTSSTTSEKSIYLISDFQKGITDFTQLTHNDSNVKIYLVAIAAQEVSNLVIDSCWFATPVRQVNQPDAIHVRIKNNSENGYNNLPVKLYINGKQKALTSISIEGNTAIETTLSFTISEAGVQQGVVSITDYPVTFDDNFYFSFDIAAHVDILNIFENDSSRYINALFGKSDYFILHNAIENYLDYSTFNRYSLIILSELQAISSGLGQELRKFIQNGGNVLVFPSRVMETKSYQDFLLSLHVNYYTELDTFDSKVAAIHYESKIWENVFEKEKLKKENIDLPVVKQHFRFSGAAQTDEEVLLSLQNGNSFLSQYASGQGSIYLSSVALQPDFSNFIEHALFVPILYNIALYSQHLPRLFYTLKQEDKIELNKRIVSNEKMLHLKNKDMDIIPEIKNTADNTYLFLHDQIRKDGEYYLTAGDSTLQTISFNYNRKESDLSCYTMDELREQYEKAGLTNVFILKTNDNNFTQTIHEMKEGKKLWKLCILLVLVFLAVETLLIRWLK